ncbi:MAG: DUF7437 domain-containing protein [Halorhabdus sp.]
MDRHGINGVATALIYAVDRERGEITHHSTFVQPLAPSTISPEVGETLSGNLIIREYG